MEEKHCAKCGRPAQLDQAFCSECLAEMEKYPVKPGVVVLLPHRETQPPKPAGRRKPPAPSPEELVKKLKKRIISLTLALILALAAVSGLVWYAVADYYEELNAKPLPGQNYSSENSSNPSEAD